MRLPQPGRDDLGTERGDLHRNRAAASPTPAPQAPVPLARADVLEADRDPGDLVPQLQDLSRQRAGLVLTDGIAAPTMQPAVARAGTNVVHAHRHIGHLVA